MTHIYILIYVYVYIYLYMCFYSFIYLSIYLLLYTTRATIIPTGFNDNVTITSVNPRAPNSWVAYSRFSFVRHAMGPRGSFLTANLWSQRPKAIPWFWVPEFHIGSLIGPSGGVEEFRLHIDSGVQSGLHVATSRSSSCLSSFL